MRLVLYVMLVMMPLTVLGQADTTKQDGASFGQRLVYGGNLGLAFGDVTVIDISPNVGYKVTEKLIVGPGVTYLYYNDRVFQYRTQVYGGRVYGQYLFNQYLFAYGEYEVLNGQFDRLTPDKRISVVSPLIGGGYYQRMGAVGGFSFMILYNLNDSRYSPHGRNPVLRGGFNFGL